MKENIQKILKIIKANKVGTIGVSIVFSLWIGFPKIIDIWQDMDFVQNKLKKQYDMNIKVVQKIKNIHVNTVTSKKSPYVSSIGSWYKLRLTNTGQKPYALVDIIYDEKEKISSFHKYYLKDETIYIANELELPRQIQINESIEMYIFLPFELNKKIGKKVFSQLHKNDNKMDTFVELYLYGKSPEMNKSTIPLYDQNKNFRQIIEVNIKIMNWDEYFAPRKLFKNMNFEKNIMPFDFNMHDGFSYMSKNSLLAHIALTDNYKIQCNQFRKENYITLSFITNTDQSFTRQLYIDSTCLQLDKAK